MALTTWNPSDKGTGVTLSNGNLTAVTPGSGFYGTRATIGYTVTSSAVKVYFEIVCDSIPSGNEQQIGVATSGVDIDNYEPGLDALAYIAERSGVFMNNGSTTASTTWTTGDVIQVAFDTSTGKIWFGKNNTWMNSGNPASGTSPAYTVTSSNTYYPVISSSSATTFSARFANAHGPTYTPPSGFVMWEQDAVQATWSPTDKDNDITISNANKTATVTGSSSPGTGRYQNVRGNVGKASGKWYFEVTCTDIDTGGGSHTVGIGTSSASLTEGIGSDSGGYGYEHSTGNKWHTPTYTNLGATYTSGDKIGVAYDLDNGKIWWSKNGTWLGSGDPGAGTNAAFTGLSGTFYPMFSFFYSSGTGNVTINQGESTFAYTVPSGFTGINGSGSSDNVATIAVTEDQDTAAISGTYFAPVTAAIAVTEDADSFYMPATFLGAIPGDIAVTEDADGFSATGTYFGPVIGDISVTEAEDTASMSGHSSSAGTSVVTLVGAKGTSLSSPGYLWFSEDNGDTWTERSVGGGACTAIVQASDGGNWVIGTGLGGIKITSDLQSFSNIVAETTAVNEVAGLAANNGVVIMVRKDGKIFKSSDDGASWTQKATGLSTRTGVATNGSGTWVSVGNSSKIYYSTDDGDTWTLATIPGVTRTFNDVTYGDGKFFAIGTSPCIYSSDGITWSAVTVTPPASASPLSTSYGDGTWASLFAYLTSAVYIKSTTSVSSWGGAAVGITGVVSATGKNVRYLNDTWYALGQFSHTPGQSTSIFRSPDAVTWTRKAISATTSTVVWDGAYGLSDVEEYTYGTFVVTESPDTVVINGATYQDVTGTISITEDADNVEIFVIREIPDAYGDLVATEAPDTLDATGNVTDAVIRVAWIAAVENPDVVYIGGSSPIFGDIAATEAQDEVLFTQDGSTGETMPITILQDTVDQIVTFGAELFNGGTISIYSGSQPATPADAPTGNLLAEVEMPDPAFTDADTGVSEMTGTWEGVVVNNGVAGWFRMVSADGTNKIDGSVTPASGSGNMIMSNTSLLIGDPVEITSVTFEFDFTP